MKKKKQHREHNRRFEMEKNINQEVRWLEVIHYEQ